MTLTRESTRFTSLGVRSCSWQPHDRPDTRRLAAWGALGLVALTLAAYVPALHGGNVWDDDAYHIRLSVQAE